jgi:hypothetical protein
VTTNNNDDRQELLEEIQRLAEIAVFGTLSETYRTCGQKNCRCHGPGPRHGPHLHISYRGPEGKTVGYYVPKAAHSSIRDGSEAWKTLQQLLRPNDQLPASPCSRAMPWPSGPLVVRCHLISTRGFAQLRPPPILDLPGLDDDPHS